MHPTLRSRCAITVAALAVLATPLTYPNEPGPLTGTAAAAPADPGSPGTAVPPDGTGPAPAAAVSGPGAAAPAPDPHESLAGHPAGEGRIRPGRPPHHIPPRPRDETDGPSPKASVSQSGTGTPSGPPSVTGTGDPSAAPVRQDPDAPAADGDLLPPEGTDGTDGWRGDDDPAAEPTPYLTGDAPSAAGQRRAGAGGTRAAHEFSPLSLGVGLALMGLGIGFLGLRLRHR
ncbi:hypothetical protein [Streptomyces qinzhouensis]|uniref:Uncharacterized protein n=1 Tax=Streptomyces qinzhouensis TaxID=2599401 RepID=A0A5B8J942_9ACTN|nr:hypothetical protein [Streptomyces qinzhouensis]QDY77887.1 hypothetical protein FQU76_16805 [Streptomyces qinzhouensis]